jgi:hypothetical protein
VISMIHNAAGFLLSHLTNALRLSHFFFLVAIAAPVRRAIGACAECCNPCAAADAWPSTIYLTLTGITACPCPTNGTEKFDGSGGNMEYTLTQLFPGVNSWANATSMGGVPVVDYTYNNPNCQDPTTPPSTTRYFAIGVATSVSGGACVYQVTIGLPSGDIIGQVTVPPGDPLGSNAFSLTGDGTYLCGTILGTISLSP